MTLRLTLFPPSLQDNVYTNDDGSGIVSVTFLDQNGVEKPVSGLEDEITITIPLLNPNDDRTPSCQYFHPATKTFRTDGCRVDEAKSKEGVVVCKCNHLTDFTVVMESFTGRFNVITK